MQVLRNAVLAALVLAFYIALIYGFFVYLWPRFPGWLAMLAFIALAVFVIGSPILWLWRVAERLRRQREAGQSSDSERL